MAFEEKKGYMKEIDMAKGIGIILVMLGHQVTEGTMLRTYIYSFHMPLFFILVGMVFDFKQQLATLRECVVKEWKLLTNYLFWSSIYILYDLLVRCLIQKSDFRWLLFWDTMQTVVLFGINVLWFIISLFLVKVMIRRLKFLRTIKGLVVVFILMMMSFFVLPFTDILQAGNIGLFIYYIIVAILRLPLIMFFVLLGYYGRQILSWKKIFQLFITVISSVVWLALAKFVGTVDIHIMNFDSPATMLVTSVSGSLMVIGICSLLKNIKVLQIFMSFWGRNSMFIMLTHEYFQIRLLIGMAVARILQNTGGQSVVFVCMLIFEYFMCIGLAPRINVISNRFGQMLQYSSKSLCTLLCLNS